MSQEKKYRLAYWILSIPFSTAVAMLLEGFWMNAMAIIHSAIRRMATTDG